MKNSLETFVRCPQTEEAAHAFDDLNGGVPVAMNIVVEGPRHSSKSTLARSLADDAQRNGADLMVFVCSGADVALALLDETNDDFFEKIGSIPVVVLDDVAPLERAEKGDQLLSLLLDERKRLGLSTAIMVDGKLSDYNLPESAPKLEEFRVIEMAPMDAEGHRAIVKAMEAEYRRDASPALTDDAIDFIAGEFSTDAHDWENAIMYLMSDEDCAALGTIDKAKAAELLQI